MKKWMTILLAVCLSFSLMACGSRNDETTQEETAVQTQEATAVESAAEPETAVVEETQEKEDSSAESVSGDTLGQTLLAVFQDKTAENADSSAQELADALLGSEAILFSGASMPVEPGLLNGFGNAEITGFKEGVMFAPAIGTIPFVGYVFTLEDGTDADAFIQTLTENADPRWNICTEAEETVIESAGNKVFFLMCPKSLEE